MFNKSVKKASAQVNNTNSNKEEMVINMKRNNSKKSNNVLKAVCVIAAIAAVAVTGTVIASAKTEYDTVIVNGQEKQANYKDYGINTRMWEFTENDTTYSVFVHGDYDRDNDKLYIKDCGDYIIASTESEPTLNLYKDIDKSDFAEFKEENGEKYLNITDDAGTMRVLFSDDEKDGEADGKIVFGDDVKETYTLLPNGAVVNAMKEKNVGFKHIIDSVI